MESDIVLGLVRSRWTWIGGAALVVGCSLVTDLGSLTNPDASVPDGAPASCKSGATQCVPAPPAGWSAPFLTYDGDPANRPPGCPASALVSVLNGHAGLLDAGGFSCGACTCSVTNIGCTPALVYGYKDSGCGAVCQSASVEAGACVPYPFSAACGASVGSVRIISLGAVADCNASAPTDGGSAVWQRDVLGCGTSYAGAQIDCANGEVCLPKAPNPFNAKPCIMKVGAGACPGAPYSEQRMSVFTKLDVGCDCDCDPDNPPSGTCDGGIDYVGTSSSCTPLAQPTAACRSGAFDTTGHMHITAYPPSTLACSTVGSNSVRSITPSAPVTVCCMP